MPLKKIFSEIKNNPRFHTQSAAYEFTWKLLKKFH